ncbi:hypothetical protein [Methanobrevibacter sp.]|uniref:hypothetical protein n=1 Tax=Methanobrevibacter sp. TaxID=66852 RepID=UPI00388F95E0
MSASEYNSTDFACEIQEESPIAIDSNEYEETTLEYSIESTADNNLKSESLNTEISKEGNDELDAVDNSSTKATLKVTSDSNFVKKGNTYYLYLTDASGNKIAAKKLTIEFDGKNYTKTTDKNGKFGIPVNLDNSTASMNISFSGDDKYDAFTQLVDFYIDKSMTIEIGNAKLLTNGYLRIYLKGTTSAISGKTIKIKVGDKTFTKKTGAEGFVVLAPKVSKGTYDVTVTYNNYTISKKIKCIVGNVLNPFKKAIPLVNGVPDIDRMPASFVMGDGDAKYTLTKAQYRATIKRDSYSLFLYGKLSKYTFFKTKSEPNKYHVLKREKWNVIERELNTKLVKKNKYNYWPATITANLKGKSYTYSEVRDVQNTEYTCGPTSASVCSQALRNYFSEKYFQVKAHVKNGVNLYVLKKAVDRSKFKSTYFYSMSTAVKQLAKGGCAVIAYLPNHYVSVIDVSKDGKKILVSNSYGKYNVGGDTKIPTNWVTLKKFNKKFRGVGIIVKPNYKLSKTVKTHIKCLYKSMGTNYMRKNTSERIPDVPI